MANRNVRLKNKIGDILYPYTDNVPIATTSTAGKVQLDSSPTSDSSNAITSGAVYTALYDKLFAYRRLCGSFTNTAKCVEN